MKSSRVGICLVGLVGICLVSLVWALVVYAAQDSHVNSDRGANPSRQPSSQPSNGAAINLECSAGNAVQSPVDANLRGIGASFLGWRPEARKDANLEDMLTINLWGRRFYQVKSPISVFADASARTQISLISPSSARFYYTDWGTWARLGSDPEQSRRLIAKDASSVVSVPQCGEEGWTVPGMLLLEGPTCLRFLVSGQETASEAVTVPFFMESC